ncbi:transcriptional regulator, RpiR family [Clostridium amylolyticum]|uniref:Transcriptional regulator, RpiR family n=2 Tax=Clostridium amylolyticum TaxID=1121298 RepID=A0A1M6LSW3_9CLOT|nr:transcriptional regulator, RpiR family [Clostridium amylolyticum]
MILGYRSVEILTMKTTLIKDRSELTKSENKICDYIEEYMNNSIYMTVTEIANNCGVGEATVTRFCRKLGFRSFLEFKMTMAQELKGSSNFDEIEDGKIQESDSIEIIAKKFYDTSVKFLDKSLNKIDFRQLEEITELLLNANRIHFVGVGNSGIIAEDTYYKFMKIGLNCNFYKESHTIAMMSPLMKTGEVMFIISRKGNTPEINTSAEIAKENGVKIVSITENLLSKLVRVSDYVINYEEQETKLENEILTSRIPEMFIIDLIYTNVVRKNLKNASENKEKTSNALELISKQQ